MNFDKECNEKSSRKLIVSLPITSFRLSHRQINFDQLNFLSHFNSTKCLFIEYREENIFFSRTVPLLFDDVTRLSCGINCNHRQLSIVNRQLDENVTARVFILSGDIWTKRICWQESSPSLSLSLSLRLFFLLLFNN